jgi:hypothetical protein
MTKDTANTILVCVLCAGLVRLAWAWYVGKSYMDVIGGKVVSLALLGFIYMAFRRTEK